MKRLGITSRWTPLLLILVVLIVFGGDLFNNLVTATKGDYKGQPFTALGVANPNQNFTGFAGGSYARLEIYNATEHDRTYRWKATLNGRDFGHGSVKVAVGKTEYFRLSLKGTKKYDIVKVSLVGMPQYVQVQVWPHSPVSYVQMYTKTTSTTAFTNITGRGLKSKLQH